MPSPTTSRCSILRESLDIAHTVACLPKMGSEQWAWTETTQTTTMWLLTLLLRKDQSMLLGSRKSQPRRRLKSKPHFRPRPKTRLKRWQLYQWVHWMSNGGQSGNLNNNNSNNSHNNGNQSRLLHRRPLRQLHHWPRMKKKERNWLSQKVILQKLPQRKPRA